MPRTWYGESHKMVEMTVKVIVRDEHLQRDKNGAIEVT